MLTCLSENTTFYELVQMHPELDLRDNRGKLHDLGLILVGIVLGLLRKRDGVLSSIHRSMVHTHARLCKVLGVENEGVVSRSHLPIVLKKVDLDVFERLLFSHYGIELSEKERKWFAVDGKELRGSILKGHKRGEALVQVVEHQSCQCVAQSFYHGRKESEKSCVQELIKSRNLLSQSLSMDALHMIPKTLGEIAQAGGIFLVGLKDNQQELAEDMAIYPNWKPSMEQNQTVEKGHGRLEIRSYDAYCVKGHDFGPRWEDSQFASLIRVKRERTELANGKHSQETAYFLSNESTDKAAQLFRAVRKHWAVETNNHIRDVSLREDQFRTKKTKYQKPWLVLEP